MRNDIEQDSMIKIRTRNLEAERQALDIERDSEDGAPGSTARHRGEARGAARRGRARTRAARD